MAWKRDATYLLTVCNQRNGLAEAKYYHTSNEMTNPGPELGP